MCRSSSKTIRNRCQKALDIRSVPAPVVSLLSGDLAALQVLTGSALASPLSGLSYLAIPKPPICLSKASSSPALPPEMVGDLEEIFGGVEERDASHEELELVPLPTVFDPSALLIDSSDILGVTPEDGMTSLTRGDVPNGDLSRQTPPPLWGDERETEALEGSANEILGKNLLDEGEGAAGVDDPALQQILHHLAQTIGESEVDGVTKEEVDTGERAIIILLLRIRLISMAPSSFQLPIVQPAGSSH